MTPMDELIEQRKRLAKAEEVALILNVTKTRVYALAKGNILPPGVVIRIGRQLRFDLEALREWIAQGGSTEKRHAFE